MSRTVGGVLTLLLALPALAVEDKPKDKPPTPQEQYDALLKENQDAMTAFSKAYQEAKTAEAKQKVVDEKYPKPEKLAPRFLELAEKNPKDPVAVDALIWVVSNTSRAGKDDTRAKAVALLLRDHVDSDKMSPLCQNLVNAYDKESLDLLRGIREKNPNKDVRAEATVALAQRLSNNATVTRLFKDKPEMVKRYEEFLGKELVEELRKADADKTEAEGEKLFQEFADKYAAGMKPDRLVQLCQRLGGNGEGGEALLRALMDKDTRREVQGAACLALGQSLKARADRLADAGKDADKARHDGEQVLERAADKYADVKMGFRGTVGDVAKAELFELRFLAIGKVVPEVEGEDADSKKFKLSDYRGKVVLIDFWGNW